MKRLIPHAAAAILLFAPAVALAATTVNCPPGANYRTDTLCNPLGYKSLTEFLRRLLQLVVEIGFPVITLFIVYIGFMYVSSGGNPEKLKKVHQYFFWALVGSLLILGSWALTIAIQGTVRDLQQGL